ncbi:sigma-70 family RNA polymerase sigma factor [Streptomyces sp. NPDC056002]|uniref:sigma-70 family RNA polymerase sigma factor n=1 Tax=Streptomyces sp. NPDC056002 TaxID=3345675 RepID=UPI0035D94274
MPEALDGGENTACTPACLEAEDPELTPDGLALLDRDLGGDEGQHTSAQRRSIDGKIVERLRAEGFQGPHYQKVVNRLAEYGYHTMTKWTANGEIFRKARQAGRPVPTDKISLTWTGEDRHGVAVDSVLGGLNVFRTYALIEGRWSPEGGASLDTYFMGAVIGAFPRIYIRWFDSHKQRQTELDHPTGDGLDAPFSLVPDQRATDPMHIAVTHDYVSRLLPLVTDPQVREALGWRALGYTQAQAAQRVGLTEKALERRTSRLRDRLTKQVRQLELGEGGTR